MIERMAERHSIQATILAGTELPLLLDAPEAAGLPVLDTTELHVRAICAAAVGASSLFRVGRLRSRGSGLRLLEPLSPTAAFER